MSARIVVLAGDGVGPEVTAAAVRVLKEVAVKHALKLEFEDALIGGAAYRRDGLAVARRDGGDLQGFDGHPARRRRRSQMGRYSGAAPSRAGVARPFARRSACSPTCVPVTTMPELAAASPLKPEKLEGVDILVIRELTGGIYFGKRSRSADAAFDTCEYTVAEIERVCRVAGSLALRTPAKS